MSRLDEIRRRNFPGSYLPPESSLATQVKRDLLYTLKRIQELEDELLDVRQLNEERAEKSLKSGGM